MNYLNALIFFPALLVYVFLAFQAIYLFVFSLAGRIISLSAAPQSNHIGSFVIYIPSYKEDAVIIDTALAALAINYPENKKHVVVIADSLKPETLVTLRSLPVQVVEVTFDKSTKAKALNVALKQTILSYDYALVLDADNVCAKDFLLRMNEALQSGYRVVQGQRVAKNTDTNYALLDAISEGINNHIFRKGHRALGLSCAIIGSGMALEFDLFKAIMPEITAVGGFDKEMELRLLKQRIRFGYAENAIVYDEKINQLSTLQNQRRRWLSAQLNYMKKYVGEGFVQLFKGNFDFFDKVIQTLLLPRLILLGITPVMFMLSLLPGHSLPPVYWLLLWIVTYTAIILAVPPQYFDRRLFKAIVSLPAAFFTMFKLLFKLKNANRTFIHTPHGEAK
ncbi:cellulose synthase/poly-beta-1,6-N-acetylglucosamine synthase-like glycosyltransferase [Mucilaginibacter frigoritolerans]|uniref:Cellulose synthase/poly-beta-1,6-N-acetylglucosamine synthase-like glycosyltransferase n=1 Tax=Mucilaginibacter frigoritolerans TaxID=652788 RepID=A0A562TQM7_9SPHI|nr:glycosyltransferase [Mucilaginibacter frigoritolerans]TWI95528.1 cellulose synthase/poly-beta-1,6-N-acetylglucosamine synthase-like glycosyltransferase [Mucilaginibacter frigoritolerans]